MSSDISANVHDPLKKYSSVRAQQGRVWTDADFNSAMQIMQNNFENLVRTMVCAAGTSDKGFKISDARIASQSLPESDPITTIELDIDAGSFVLGGKTIMLASPQTFLEQTDWLAMQLDANNFPIEPVVGRTDLCFLSCRDQIAHSSEDRELQERSLGQGDTTTRVRPQLQVHIVSDVIAECALAHIALGAELAGAGGVLSEDKTEILSNARLSVSFTTEDNSDDPCAPRSVANYLGAENQTLRIMLTEPGRFVWAPDNASELYRVQVDNATQKIVFLSAPKDPVLFPRPDQVIEILPWDVLLPNQEKLAANLGHRAMLTSEYDPTTQTIDYDGSLPSAWQAWLDTLAAENLSETDEPQRFFYARIWQAPTGGGLDQATGPAVDLAGTGIRLNFSGVGFAGDSWSASFRSNAPELVVPWQLQSAQGAAPDSPSVFFAPLALIHWEDNGAGIEARVDDCRNTFRKLCQIESCCTFHVGDGKSTFGDFNSIQDAVNALPVEGGEICLLPGRHNGGINLENLSNIVIHGCGSRSVVVDSNATGDATFVITGANSIVLRDFSIETDNGLAVFANAGTDNIRLQRLNILVVGAALVLYHGDVISIEQCNISSKELDAAIDDSNIDTLSPMIFISGSELLVRQCTLTAEETENRNRRAVGGIQVGGGSESIRIVDNTIKGGNGNGISLGSVVESHNSIESFREGDVIVVTARRRDYSRVDHGWYVIDEDGCIKLQPPSNFPPDKEHEDDELPPHYDSEGDIVDIEICRNRIIEHGASGISVAYWFIPYEGMHGYYLDDIEVEQARIGNNHIESCMQLDIANSLNFEAAFLSASGGITLSSVIDTQIENNDIHGCGAEGRTPICAIYLRYTERVHITSNRCYDNGRVATVDDLPLIGSIGGIVIPYAEGNKISEQGETRKTPAVVIKDNVVVVQEGRALDLSGEGQMVVESNVFTTHGNNIASLIMTIFAEALANLFMGRVGDNLYSEKTQAMLQSVTNQMGGSAISIHNTGINPYFQSYAAIMDNYAKSFSGLLGNEESSQGEFAGAESTVGSVMFNDNQVTFDASSSASTMSISSISIVSGDDISMHDNQCYLESQEDTIFLNAVVFAASVRVQGNRFREVLSSLLKYIDENAGSNSGNSISLASILSIGVLNATELNQSTLPIRVFGTKTPRIVFDASGNPVLDTNRNLVN